MALYHVYARVNNPSAQDYLIGRRYLLTCASRYHADEFFRAFEARMGFRRISAQFWDYMPVDLSVGMLQVPQQADVDLSICRGVQISMLPDSGVATPFSPAPATAGRDWLSGGAYFIRNVRQPDLYWYHPAQGDNCILASKWQRTKFFVRLSGAEESERGTVLIRSDRVRISTASQHARGMVVRKGDDSRMIVVSPTSASVGTIENDFRFGDLLGTFGTDWESRAGVPHEYVTWGDRSEMHLEDWELC